MVSFSSKEGEYLSWRARKSLLPCRLQVTFRGFRIASLTCPICSSAGEDPDHALLACWAVRGIWSAICHWCGIDFSDVMEVADLASEWILKLVPVKNRPILQTIIMCSSWVIWKARNKLVMEGVQWCSVRIISDIQVLSHLWIFNRASKEILPSFTILVLPLTCEVRWTCRRCNYSNLVVYVIVSTSLRGLIKSFNKILIIAVQKMSVYHIYTSP